MNRLGSFLLFSLATIVLCVGTLTVSAQDNSSSDNSVHGVIGVTLAKSLDSKKLKEGDPVTAETTHMLRTGSGVLISSGTKVMGHVTEAKASSKGDSGSSLSIVFDKIMLSGGKELAIKGTVQAVGPAGGSGPDTGAAGGNNMNSGGGRGTGSAGTTASPAAGLGQQGAGGGGAGGRVLDQQSTGVVGIKSLTLENGVLTSTGKEVKLDSGSQIMIKME